MHQNWHGVEIIDGNTEEALDLGCMEVEGHDTIATSHLNAVGTDTCTDRDPRLIFLIPLGITEVGNNCSDRSGTCSAECIDPEEQFHEAIIGGKDGTLDNIDIASAHILKDTHKSVTFREGDHLTSSGLDAQAATDRLGQALTAATSKDKGVV